MLEIVVVMCVLLGNIPQELVYVRLAPLGQWPHLQGNVNAIFVLLVLVQMLVQPRVFLVHQGTIPQILRLVDPVRWELYLQHQVLLNANSAAVELNQMLLELIAVIAPLDNIHPEYSVKHAHQEQSHLLTDNVSVMTVVLVLKQLAQQLVVSVLLVNFRQDLENANFVLKGLFQHLKEQLNVKFVLVELSQILETQIVWNAMLVNIQHKEELAKLVQQEHLLQLVDSVSVMTVVLVLKQLAQQLADFVLLVSFRQDLENANFVLKGPFQHPKEQLNVKFALVELNQILETQIVWSAMLVNIQHKEELVKLVQQEQLLLLVDNASVMAVVLVLKQLAQPLADSVLLVNFRQDLVNVNFVLKEVFQHPKEQLNVKFVLVELNQMVETQTVWSAILVNIQHKEELVKLVQQGRLLLLADNVNVMTVVLVLKQLAQPLVVFVLLVNFRQDLENVNFVLKEVFQHPKERLNAKFVLVELNQMVETQTVWSAILVNTQHKEELVKLVQQGRLLLLADNASVMTVVLVLKQLAQPLADFVLLVNFLQDLENVNFVLQEVFQHPKEQLNANFTSVCVEMNQILEILDVIFVMLVNFHQMKDIANHVHQEQCHLMMGSVNVMTVVLVLKQHQ